MTPLDKAARMILKNCLGVRAKESVLIIIEDSLWALGETFWKYAKRLSKLPTLYVYSSSSLNAQAFPDILCHCLQSSEAALFLSKQLVNSELFNEARKKGTRVLVIQDASRKLLERLAKTDYDKISHQSRRIAEIFTIGKRLKLTSPSGTEASISISRIKGTAETGQVRHNGDISFLPAGQSCLVLHKDSLNGRIILDGIAGSKNAFKEPIVLNVKNGQITQIKGNKAADNLRKELRKFGKHGRTIYEIGVGTNYAIKLGHSALEDAKVLGTIHIAFGKNHVTKVRGKFNQTTKGLIKNPTLSIDGKLIIKDGKLLV
ncbi:MAG: hypothetical protein ACE5HO_06825 [bacterium]